MANRFLGLIATASGLYLLGAAFIYHRGDYHGVIAGVVFVAIGITGLIARLPRQYFWECGFLLLVPLGVMSLLSTWGAWESWRAYTLLKFCNTAHVGMSVPDLLRLERQHWIDNSYLVEARFPGFIDQTHALNLSFRSHMYDPDFECAIGHNGAVVTSVQLLE